MNKKCDNKEPLDFPAKILIDQIVSRLPTSGPSDISCPETQRGL